MSSIRHECDWCSLIFFKISVDFSNLTKNYTGDKDSVIIRFIKPLFPPFGTNHIFATKEHAPSNVSVGKSASAELI